jgi:alpha-soluble NSF attachment protein
VKCAECRPEEAANYFSEAGNVLRKVNTSEAVTYYNRAVEIMVSSGKISMGARLRKQIAEIYEADEMLGLAAQNYAHAAELYEMDNGDSTANSCLLKVAELSTFESLDTATIIKAIKIFEDVGERYLMHNLTRFSAKDSFFKAGLLYLANDDLVGAENGSNKYSMKDPSYETSRENKLVRDLVGAIRGNDVNGFETVLYAFNRITPIDRWKTKVLLKAKSFINKEVEEDFS